MRNAHAQAEHLSLVLYGTLFRAATQKIVGLNERAQQPVFRDRQGNCCVLPHVVIGTPGNRGWTPVVSQQAGFPCQMLLREFLGCHPSAPENSSSLTAEQRWVSKDCCASDTR